MSATPAYRVPLLPLKDPHVRWYANLNILQRRSSDLLVPVTEAITESQFGRMFVFMEACDIAIIFDLLEACQKTRDRSATVLQKTVNIYTVFKKDVMI